MKNKLNKNGMKDGFWEYYNFNGDISSAGNYLNGNRVGYWEYFIYLGRTLLTKMSHIKGSKERWFEHFADIK
jgi:antitoxin component YwqK of YwqJK toxin-antitoxin module